MIDPRSAPLEALTAGALATKPTFDAVTFEEFAPDSPPVRVVVAALFVELAGSVVIVVIVVVVAGGARRGAVVLVVVVGATVKAMVEVVTASGWVTRECGGLVEALSVKTNTKSRSGLDHITHCVLLSDWRSLTGVLEGRSPGQGEIVVHS